MGWSCLFQNKNKKFISIILNLDFSQLLTQSSIISLFLSLSLSLCCPHKFFVRPPITKVYKRKHKGASMGMLNCGKVEMLVTITEKGDTWETKETGRSVGTMWKWE